MPMHAPTVQLVLLCLQVDTVCEVTGNYAEMGTTNW